MACQRIHVFEDRDGSKTNNDLTLVRILGIGMIVKTTSREESEGVCIHALLLQRVYIYMDWENHFHRRVWGQWLLPRVCIRVYIYMDRETTSREENEVDDCFPVSAGSFSPGVDSLLLLLHHPTSLGYLTLHWSPLWSGCLIEEYYGSRYYIYLGLASVVVFIIVLLWRGAR